MKDCHTTSTTTDTLLFPFITVTTTLSAILAIAVAALTVVAVMFQRNKVNMKKMLTSATQQNTKRSGSGMEVTTKYYEEIDELRTSTKMNMDITENVAYSTITVNN